MVVLVMFDAYVNAYDINGELHFLRSKPEIDGVRLLSRKEGDAPKYCLEITAQDGAEEMIKKEIDKARSAYASEVSNLKLVTYSVV